MPEVHVQETSKIYTVDGNPICGMFCESIPIDPSAADVDLTAVVKNGEYTQVGIRVGGFGDVKFDVINPSTGAAKTDTWKNVSNGEIIYGYITKVYSAANGTTATNLSALS